MTTVQHILNSIAPELRELNQRIADTLSTDNAMMNRIVTNYLSVKGKQIRPILVLLSAKMFGSVSDKAMYSAAAIEMLHNASLIHDDVIDETRVRRGHDTINAIWDNHIAVLVGDFFVSSSLQTVLRTGDIECIELIAQLGRTLSLGEIDQIDKARTHTLTEDAYFDIISSKTASLFVACVRMGALSSGADAGQIERISRVGHLLGLCFQIRDDIFDYFDDASNIGKPTGNDLREGKVTLPLLYALQHSDLPDTPAMNALVREAELTDADIATLTAFARQAGGIDYAYSRMASLRDEAAAILDTFPESETRADFLALLDYIIERKF